MWFRVKCARSLEWAGIVKKECLKCQNLKWTCKGVIRERILTASQGIVARGRECECRRHVWVESPGTRLPSSIMFSLSSGDIIPTSQSCCKVPRTVSICGHQQQLLLLLFFRARENSSTSGGLTLIGARCDYCPLGPVASERASY